MHRRTFLGTLGAVGAMTARTSPVKMAVVTTVLIAGGLSGAAAQSSDRDEAAIRSARDGWNRAIEKRDVAALGELLSDTFHAIGGAGHIPGRDAAVTGAARLFTQRADLFYEYRPARIRVVADHGLASEYGEWIERWKEPTGMTEMRGTYYALWRRSGGKWLIEGEVEMPETCVGSDYCKPR